jgi:mRNA-degrading endonuclease RelE of RelBE toxin-antitoxin system
VYEPKFAPGMAKAIKKLPKITRDCLRDGLERIVCNDPVGCSEELTGPLAGFRSFHCENYRVIYKVCEDHKVVAIVGIAQKSIGQYAQMYKTLGELAMAGKFADSLLKHLQLLRPQ